jgi:hypothetical protein
VNPDAVSLIDRYGAPVAGHEFGAVTRRRRRDQGIVRSATRDSVVGKLAQELSVDGGAESEKLPLKLSD